MKLVTAVYHQVTAKTSLQIDPKKLPPTAILQLPVSPRKQNHTTKKHPKRNPNSDHHRHFRWGTTTPLPHSRYVLWLPCQPSWYSKCDVKSKRYWQAFRKGMYLCAAHFEIFIFGALISCPKKYTIYNIMWNLEVGSKGSRTHFENGSISQVLQVLESRAK